LQQHSWWNCWLWRFYVSSAKIVLSGSAAAKHEKDAGPFQSRAQDRAAEPKAGETAFENHRHARRQAVSNATVSLKLSMPAMPGMKATDVKLAGADGTYKGIGNLSMGGDWEIQVNVKDGSGEAAPRSRQR